MRALINAVLILCFSASPLYGQSVGDSVYTVNPVQLKKGPSQERVGVTSVNRLTPLKIVGIDTGGRWLRVSAGGQTGWVYHMGVSEESLLALRNRLRENGRQDSLQALNRASEELAQKAEEKRQEEQQRASYFQSLTQQGFTIALLNQNFQVNSADGITLWFEARNISSEKTIKYIDVTWKFYNPVGDPATGQMDRSSTRETRLVGPVRPSSLASVTWEDVIYSSVATCAEVRRIKVTHMDESSFVYVNDLDKIDKYSDVKLRGDCAVK